MFTATIRPATADDAAAIAHVHVASWRTSYAALLPAELLAGLSEGRRAAFWAEVLRHPAPPGTTLVAEHPRDGVVGFANAGPAEKPVAGYELELRALYLLEPHQRGGLGRALVRATAEALVARGHTSIFLWVFAANPARRFYEALGGQFLCDGEVELGGVIRSTVAYGWPELAQLVKARPAQA